jgi:subtilisin family serine protease
MRVLELLIDRRLASFAAALFCICFGVSCSNSEAPPAQSADAPQADALKTEAFRGNEVSANEIVFKVADCETDDRTAFLARVTNIARELTGEEDIEVSQVGNGCWFLARSSRRSASELLDPFLSQIQLNRAAAPELKQVPEIVDAEPNFIIRLKPHPDDRPVQGSPDDDYFQRGELWGLANQQYPDVHIDALRAWQVSKGSQQIVVGVIDTGIYYLHPDLQANVWCAPRDFTVTLGTDKINCPSGSHGFNVVGRTDAERCDPLDGIRNPGHGTHVSGTIGAIGDNQRGVVGVNWTTRLLGLKFMKYGDGTAANAKRAIDFAVELKKELKLDADIRVLNLSWGYRSNVTTKSDSDMLREAIEDAGKKGILVVASAGEDGGSNNDEIEHYPSGFNLENVVSVTAIDRKGFLVDRANYGMTSVHLSAPGGEIYSTYSMNLGIDYYVSGGTSMAAAFVSGAAALILSVPQCSKLSPADLKQVILRGVSSLPTPSSTPIPTSSGGMLGVYKSIEQCSTEAVLTPRNH